MSSADGAAQPAPPVPPASGVPPACRVRPATAADLDAITALVHGLAAYERAPTAVQADRADFERALFPVEGVPAAHAHVAESGAQVVGMALWFTSFSTWTGVSGIWLEDLYVRPEHRGSGLGFALLRTLAQICVERGYARLEWWVLNWNAPSIAFYQRLGATAEEEWTRYRLAGSALRRLGEPAQPVSQPLDG